jgi:hypothetical protein
MLIELLDTLSSQNHLRGYTLALYGDKNLKRDRVGWRAKADDILGTLLVLIEGMTENKEFATEICDKIAARLSLKDDDIN